MRNTAESKQQKTGGLVRTDGPTSVGYAGDLSRRKDIEDFLEASSVFSAEREKVLAKLEERRAARGGNISLNLSSVDSPLPGKPYNLDMPTPTGLQREKIVTKRTPRGELESEWARKASLPTPRGLQREKITTSFW